MGILFCEVERLVLLEGPKILQVGVHSRKEEEVIINKKVTQGNYSFSLGRLHGVRTCVLEFITTKNWESIRFLAQYFSVNLTIDVRTRRRPHLATIKGSL